MHERDFQTIGRPRKNLHRKRKLSEQVGSSDIKGSGKQILEIHGVGIVRPGLRTRYTTGADSGFGAAGKEGLPDAGEGALGILCFGLTKRPGCHTKGINCGVTQLLNESTLPTEVGSLLARESPGPASSSPLNL